MALKMLLKWCIGRLRRRLMGFVRRLADRVHGNAWNRGMLGGSRIWFSVFCITATAKLVRKVLNRHRLPEARSEQLDAGSAVLIRHLSAKRRR